MGKLAILDPEAAIKRGQENFKRNSANLLKKVGLDKGL